MEYVFSEFNFLALILTVVAAATICLGLAGILDMKVNNRKKQFPSDYEEYKQALEKSMERLCIWIFVGALLVYLGLVINNVPARSEQLAREQAIATLAGKVEEITENRMAERCAFNGLAVDSAWIESDTFPCVTIGNQRIWSKGAALIGRDSVAVRREFVIGRINDNQSVSRVAEINLDAIERGTNPSYATDTKLLSTEINKLIESLTKN